MTDVDSRHFDENLVDQLDFGIDVPGVLIVRERNWPRAVVAFMCLLILPVAVVPMILAIRHGAAVLIVASAAIAAGLLATVFWLFWLLMHPKMFYVALSERAMYLRRGPNSLVCIPLDDVERFERTLGVVNARQKSRNQVLTVLKSGYVSAGLSEVTQRFNAWLDSPGDVAVERTSSIGQATLMLDIIAARHRLAAKVRNAGMYLAGTVLSGGIATAAPSHAVKVTLYGLSASCAAGCLWAMGATIMARTRLRVKERELNEC